MGPPPPCELSGTYRPSWFKPSVEFTVDNATSYGQLPTAISVDTDLGSIILMDGHRIYGVEGDTAISLGASGRQLIDYFRSKSFEQVSETQEITVGGLPALRVDTTEAGINEPVDLFFVEPFPFVATDGGFNRLVTVDVGDSYLAVIGYPFVPEDRDAFVVQFDDFIASLRVLEPN